MEWNKQPGAEGDGGTARVPSPAHPRSAAGRPDLRSPAGASAAAGARAEQRRAAAPGPARPPHPPRLLPARAGPTGRAPGRPTCLASRGCGLTEPARPGAPRSSSPHPTPRAWRPGGQRRFLAPALSGGRWRFESGPRADLCRRLSRGAPRLLSRPTTPPRTPDPSSPGQTPQRSPDSSKGTQEDLGGGHLRHNRRGGLLALFCAILLAKTAPRGSARAGPPL